MMSCVGHEQLHEAAPPKPTGFYSQRVDSGAIPILGSAKVSRRGLEAARDRLETILHDAPRLRRNLEARGYELHVLALEEFPSDLPEYASKRGVVEANGQLFDWHMIGGHISEDARHFSSCTEGTLLPIVGFRLYGDETCFHELGHVIDWFALDAALRARVVAEFKESTSTGHWAGQYAATNEHEWFAEITKYYFRADREDLAFYDKTLAHGHEWLCGYDARACRFAADVYGDRIDPGTPKTTTLAPSAGSLEPTTRSVEGRVPVRVIVRNETSSPLRAIWLDYAGKRDARQVVKDERPIAHGADKALFTWATHAYVITTETGDALCTIVAPEEEAVVEITGTCDR